MEAVPLPGVTLVHSPRFTGVKQSGSTFVLYIFSLVCRLMPLLFQTLACSLPNAASVDFVVDDVFWTAYSLSMQICSPRSVFGRWL